MLEKNVWFCSMGASFFVSEVMMMKKFNSIDISGMSKKELIQVLENLSATGTVYVCGSSRAYINQLENDISFDEKSLDEVT